MIAKNSHITCYIYTFPKDSLPNFNQINLILNQFDINNDDDKLFKLPNLTYYQTKDVIEEVLFITQYKLSYDELNELYNSFIDFNKESWIYVEFI